MAPPGLPACGDVVVRLASIHRSLHASVAALPPSPCARQLFDARRVRLLNGRFGVALLLLLVRETAVRAFPVVIVCG